MYGINIKYILLIFILKTIIIKSSDYVNECRLPDNIKPILYEIQLTPYLNENAERNFTFDGKIKISIKIIKDQTNSITLHAEELQIDRNSIKVYTTNNILNVTSIDTVDKYQFYVIKVNKILESGKQYVIEMEYQGKISDSLNGFYRSRYEYSDETWIAATQFSAIAARKAYPCFDEPGLKAHFQITIVHHKDYTALSNMPKDSSKTFATNERTTSTFQKTNVPMSTYVTAFALVNYNGHTSNNNLQTIYTVKFLEQNVNFSLKIADESLTFMETYTNLKYNLPKLDHLSVPEFAAGAMENWGLIMYKDRNLIFDPQTGTTDMKQKVAKVLAHEISHQWFGNRVSPKWWDYIWLSEGFATYFEYFITSNFYSKWRMMDQFVVNEQQKIMIEDAQMDTHSIKINVENPNVWTADMIAYQKAGSIIKMLNNVLEKDIFQQGLRYYLNDMNNKSAETDDLWRNIQRAIDENQSNRVNKLNITVIGNSWIENVGFPLLNAKRRYSSKSCVISQTRFFSNEFDDTQSENNNLWWIPIKIVTQTNLDFTNTVPSIWLSELQKNISINENRKWIIINAEQTGYFRVNYDDVNWSFIITYLNSTNFTHIPPTTRAQLVDDALNLAAANYLNYNMALSLTEYLQQEIDYIPWYSALRAFEKIKIHAAAEIEIDKYFKAYMQKLLTNINEQISVSNVGRTTSENDFINLARLNILPMICYVGLEDCIETSTNLLNLILSDSNTNLSNDLKSTIYCYGIKYSDEANWEKLYEKYLNSKNDVEKRRILLGLGCTEDPNILEKFLNITLNKNSDIKDKNTVFEGIYTNLPVGLNFMLNFIGRDNNNLDKNVKITLIKDMSKYLVNDEQKQKLNTIIKKFDEKTQESLQKTQKIVADNVKWHLKYMRILNDWLKSHVTITDRDSTTTNVDATTESFETTTPDGSNSNFIINYMLIFILCTLNLLYF